MFDTASRIFFFLNHAQPAKSSVQYKRILTNYAEECVHPMSPISEHWKDCVATVCSGMVKTLRYTFRFTCLFP